MRDATVITPDSTAFLRLQDLFMSLEKPCGLDELLRFNLLYSHLSPDLSPHERRRAEGFVESLMAHLEDPSLAARIDGAA